MDKKKIAEKLRALRGTKSREEVAFNCGITAAAITNYETALRIPSDDVKIKLARFFGKSVQEIFYT